MGDSIDTRTDTAWLAAAGRLLDTIERTQADAVEAASRLCAHVIGEGNLVHLFGTGHSRIPVEEMFPRYGSYPGFNPLVELSLTFHTEVVGSNGQRQAMFLERVEGLAEVILSNFDLDADDAMMVFSANGLSAAPIEMALGARARGLKVIAVTSRQQSLAGEPEHSSGTRLLDHADVVLDLCTPAADALVRLDGVPTPVGPGSTFAAVALVNAVKVRVAELLAAEGRLPPVLSSVAVAGSERSAELFDAAYGEHARRFATRLRGAR